MSNIIISESKLKMSQIEYQLRRGLVNDDLTLSELNNMIDDIKNITYFIGRYEGERMIKNV